MSQLSQAKAVYHPPALEPQKGYTFLTGVSLPIGTSVLNFEVADVPELGESQ